MRVIATLLFGGVCSVILFAGCPPSSECEVLLTCGPSPDGAATVGSGGEAAGGSAGGGGSAAGGAPVRGWKAIAAGFETTCAVDTDGTVWCWGDNEYGQLGHGMTGGTSAVPVAARGVTNATDASTDNGSCAIAGGGLLCWGIQTGAGSGASPAPVSVALGAPALDVSVGIHIGLTSQPFHSCVMLNDGSARCWGSNLGGALGVDPQVVSSSPTPVIVEGLRNADAISSGGQHTCALTGTQVRCWGAALVNSQSTASHTPVVVNGVSQPTMIAAGTAHTCAVEASGQAKCWGYGGAGQLGNGGMADSAAPVSVSSLSEVVTLAAGTSHSCASLSNGEVWCWGGNEWGELGDDTVAPSSEPVQVVGITNARSVAAGLHHSCAVLQDGRAFCWGNNQVGQLGNGSMISSSVPMEVMAP